MKKLLIGCLVILLLGTVALAIGAFLLYRTASPLLESARTYLTGVGELGELDRQVADQSRYQPPTSRELTASQVERFARVQDSVRRSLGRRMTEIDQKYQALQAERGGAREPTVREMLSALGDLGRVIVEARRYQVAALNQEKFSQDEYRWVRGQIFQAAGVEAVHLLDLGQLADAVREGTGLENVETPPMPRVEVPDANRALVKPHLEKMDEWIPLAFFGL